LLAKVYINLIDQKEQTLNFQSEEATIKKKENTNINYYKKIIEPTDEELRKHREYLKNNFKKNFFN
jgi:DNA polymerase-3 subunit epsilon